MLILPLALVIFLNGCARTIYSTAPEFPKAGAAVADDLEKCCIPPENTPALWEWLARIDKFEKKLRAKPEKKI